MRKLYKHLKEHEEQRESDKLRFIYNEQRLRYLERAVAKLGMPGREPGTHDDGTEGAHYPEQCSPGFPCWEGRPSLRDILGKSNGR